MPDRRSARARVVLVEGLPGSGKTSLAEWLYGWLGARDTPASWIPELQRDHPVIDRPTMRTARQEGYAQRCIERWAAFAEQLAAGDRPGVVVVEGCLFQSTVRFLVEYERAPDEIDGYLPAVEACLAPLRPHLVYLTQTDVAAYLEGEVDRRKGAGYVSRIATYSETTPFSRSRGLRGRSALVALYKAYREVCDGLVRRSKMPVLELDAVRLDEATVRQRASRWVEAIADDARLPTGQERAT